MDAGECKKPEDLADISRESTNKSTLHQDFGTATFLTPHNETFPYENVYKPLYSQSISLGKRFPEFRLVRICPGTEDDEVRCELISARLNAPPRYEALSYCAGDPSDSCRILLNDVPFNTFRSTFEALRAFRFADQPRMFWIDQICVNQTDIFERDDQVRLMGTIYSKASCTQVWLGPLATQPPTQLAFDLVRRFMQHKGCGLRAHIMKLHQSPSWDERADSINREMTEQTATHATWFYLRAEQKWYDSPAFTPFAATAGDRDRDWSRFPPLEDAKQWLIDSLEDVGQSDCWLAFCELLQRPWWTRCWVVQEVVVPADVYLVCGPESLAWDDLGLLVTLLDRVLIFFDYTPTQSTQKHSIRSCINLCFPIHGLRRVSPSTSLLSCLDTLQSKSAGDARDKVYASLGMLVNADETYDIVPEYALSNTVGEVYRAAAVAVLTVDKNPNILVAITGSERSVGLPSWAPNWQQTERLPMIRAKRFRAGECCKPSIKMSTDGRKVRLRGWLVDSVASLGPADCNLDATDVLEQWKTIFTQRHPAGCDDELHILQKFALAVGLDLWIWTESSPKPDPEGDAITFHDTWESILRAYCKYPNRICRGSRFFVSHLGAPGMCPTHARENQDIFIPFGCRMPLLVQKVGSRSEYEVVGQCYLHEMMLGEVLKKERSGEVKVSDIWFV